ncbi:hypothetical protein [Vreelandella olivaria]|uniref:hypothetical protein n=1 Tax=Vreelandella olivaria TaxID=390919 RepID=UPI00201F6843|nr:hypothetical protein [Halomonas olivaria]
MKINILAAMSLAFLAGCAGQGALHQNSNQEQQGLIFSVSDASYTLTPECTRSAEVDHDEDGRPMVVVSMKRSPECSEKAFETVFSKVGQHMTIEYGDQVLVHDSPIITPMNPASPFWTGVEDDALARDISEHLD